MVDRGKYEIADLKTDVGVGWQTATEIDLDAWKYSEHVRSQRNSRTGAIEDRKWRTADHKSSGLRVSGPSDFGPRDVEVSLARVLHGTNGRLVRDQDELDYAWSLVEELLRHVSPESAFIAKKVQSVELTWHFSGDPMVWVPFYSCLRHPRIESAPVSWREEYVIDDFCINAACGSVLRPDSIPVRSSPTAVTWSGERLRIALYDKVAEQKLTKVLPPVMRLEFRVLERLAHGLTTDEGRLSFSLCYERYRNLAGGFRDFRRSVGVFDSPLDFLLSLRARGVVHEADFQAFLAAQSRPTRFRYFARARSLKETWEMEPGIASRLPAEGPPPAPDVIPPHDNASNFPTHE